jgi:protein-disulfide isomerase
MLFVLSITVCWGAFAADHPVEQPCQPDASPVALIGSEAVSADRLGELLGSKLARLKTEEYAIKRAALEEYANQLLLEKEASRRQITVDELIRREVEQQVPAVPEDDARALYESAKDRFGGVPESVALGTVQANLRKQRVARRRADYTRSLRRMAGVRILIDAPRQAINAGERPFRGPTTAPVTIVEFADYQCPYCANMEPTLKQLRDRYGDRIRFAFRHFPLPGHLQAPKAAEAAECAHEQGKFWEMHAKLFENPTALQPPDLSRYAAEIGLKPDVFQQCLASGRNAEKWRTDMEEGTKYGVAGTPTFFVNGRMVGGVRPYDAFAEIIEDELARSEAPRTEGK